MDTLFLRNLIDGLHPTERLKSDLRLELRWMKFALLCFSHLLSVSLERVPLKHLSQIPGPLHTLASIMLKN
jgi:hypothetical protein